MAKYDVYASPDGDRPILIDVQAELLDELKTRVVVPLLRQSDAPAPAKRLNPVFQVNGEPYVLATQFLAAVPLSALGTPIANLAPHRDAITNALDMVFHGF